MSVRSNSTAKSQNFVWDWDSVDNEKILVQMERGHQVCKLLLGKSFEPSFRQLKLNRETRQIQLCKDNFKSNQKPATVDIRLIKEVQSLEYKLNEMKIGDKWTRDPELKKFHANHIIVIAYGQDFVLNVWIFAFDTNLNCKVWVQGLNHLRAEDAQTPHPLLIERWLRKEFYTCFDSHSNTGTLKIMKAFAQKHLQLAINSKALQEFCADDKMRFEVFANCYRQLIYVHQIFSERFSQFSKDGKSLDLDSILKFLQEEQGEEAESNREAIAAFLATYLKSIDKTRDVGEPWLTVHEFVDLLFSRDNSIFDPVHHTINQQMDRPLNHYWIASSHNTYLTGDQLKSESMLEAYARALNMGCRCIELDCWDGHKKASNDMSVVIYHGYTMTSKLSLTDVLWTIREYAFKTSEYPVILSIEDNCSLAGQRTLASELKEILGNFLVLAPVDKEETELPAPSLMKRKIIVKHKKLPTDAEVGSTLPNLPSYISASTTTMDESLQDQDLLSKPDIQKKGLFYMKDLERADDKWTPHVFVLLSGRLCYTQDTDKIMDADLRQSSVNESFSDGMSMQGDDEHHDDVTALPGGIKPEELHIAEEWFHGKISREEAVRRLNEDNKENKDGMFLVRESHTFVGDHSLSFYFRGEVHHCRIRTKMVNGEKKFFFLENSTKDTLYELISFYQTAPLQTPKFKANLTMACPQPCPHLDQPWFGGSISKQRAEELLNAYREDGAFLIRHSTSDNAVFVLSLRVDGEIFHMRLKQEGRIFLVGQTVFENLNQLVKFYEDHDIFRGICLKFPVNPDTVENYARTDQSFNSEGIYLDMNNVENDLIARTCMSYRGRDETELSFPQSVDIVVMKKTGIMWRGRYGGRVGWFPRDCVDHLAPGGFSLPDANDSKADYFTIDLNGLEIERDSSDCQHPYAFVLQQNVSHWLVQRIVVAANSQDEQMDWINSIVECRKATTDKVAALQRKEKVLRISAELSNLVVYCQAVPFNPEKIPGNFYEMCSFSETRHNKLLERGLIKFNHRQISRVYPNASRLTSLNFHPMNMWNSGCQMVALNYQTPDRPMQLNEGRFMANGRCGYVLKPEFMMTSEFDPEKSTTWDNESPITLTLEIIGGRHLRRQDRGRGKGIVSPVVEVEIHGVTDDSQTHKTRIVSCDGLHPVWNEQMEMVIKCASLALIRFQVQDADFGGPSAEPFIGQASFPVTCIRTGYRCVPLRNIYSEPLELSSLLVRVDIRKHDSTNCRLLESQMISEDGDLPLTPNDNLIRRSLRKFTSTNSTGFPSPNPSQSGSIDLPEIQPQETAVAAPIKKKSSILKLLRLSNNK